MEFVAIFIKIKIWAFVAIIPLNNKNFLIFFFFFQEKKEQTINLNLPNDLVDLRFVKNMGIISFQFITTAKNTQITGFSPYYTKKQIDKLFGKSAK